MILIIINREKPEILFKQINYNIYIEELKEIKLTN